MTTGRISAASSSSPAAMSKPSWLRGSHALITAMARARWSSTISGGISDPTRPTSLGLTTDALTCLTDPSAILDHLTRLGDTVETDPRLAVSTAKALIESTAKSVTAKSVLTARGLTYTKSDKVPALVNRAQQSLVSAKGVSEEVPALRQILQSLVTLAQGVTEVRNQVGVDHGAEGVPAWVRPRHARLVVGAAQVWCQLMLETLADPDAPWRKEAAEP